MIKQRAGLAQGLFLVHRKSVGRRYFRAGLAQWLGARLKGRSEPGGTRFDSPLARTDCCQSSIIISHQSSSVIWEASARHPRHQGHPGGQRGHGRKICPNHVGSAHAISSEETFSTIGKELETNEAMQIKDKDEFYTYMTEGWPPKPDNWQQIIEDNLNG